MYLFKYLGLDSSKGAKRLVFCVAIIYEEIHTIGVDPQQLEKKCCYYTYFKKGKKEEQENNRLVSLASVPGQGREHVP